MEKTTKVNNREVYPGYTNLITNPATFSSVSQSLEAVRDMGKDQALKFLEDLLRKGDLSLLNHLSRPKDNIVESEDQRIVAVASQIRLMMEALTRDGSVKNILDRKEGKPGNRDPLVAAFNSNGFNVRFLDDHPDNIDLENLVYAMRSEMRGVLPDAVMLKATSHGKISENVLVTALTHPDAYDVLDNERFATEHLGSRDSITYGANDFFIPTRVRPDRYRTEEMALVMLNELASRHGREGLKYMVYDEEESVYKHSIAPGAFDQGHRIFC
ncbi:hypothetical protein HOG17_04915 [Candidatus Peregrinibacteria bacterium]|nr:hypothetical protein [Candidatus Peregrinibacteria bacterium]MBT4148521.1 hypothetical protein [Candidatus Peregrinibacteria bacterium]MBT4366698.1 hypothetical protein [Candidatus Peregrinibacteria bacterium]MBT4455533.1 hypothetical protein [Candidatus Peregrinibacteria bacterium]